MLLKTNTQKIIDWTICSKYANHSRFSSQCDWRDLCDHLMSTMICKNHEQYSYGNDLTMLIVLHLGMWVLFGSFFMISNFYQLDLHNKTLVALAYLR